ncbi:MAG: hypothetical protein ACYC1M_18290 [Armatimonadota bacterium]
MKVMMMIMAALCINAAVSASASVQSIRVMLPPRPTAVMKNIVKLFARQVSSRCSARTRIGGKAELTIELALKSGIGAEGFTITDAAPDRIRITASDERGLLYGVGKLLHSSRYDQGGFTPGTWRGSSKPEGSFRAIYAATHFMNYYEAAPSEEIADYLADLALWGANAVVVTFPTWDFTGLDDPRAQKNLKQIRRALMDAKSIGLQVGLIQCPNQGYSTAPASVLATKYPDDLHRRGTLGVNCCPSSPEGHSYLTKLYAEIYDACKDIELDYLVLWPYDEGGCGCEQCWPWGAKGFPAISRDVTRLAHQRFPHIKSVLSTWVYDTPPAGEWEGLTQFLAPGNDWLDYIMADSHEDFPRYPLEKGVPGKLPLINFPEISMWGRAPWGGYGANPLPGRFQRLWNETEGKLSGGMPYSEGIYEDINKIICFQFYWQKDRSALDTLREYIAFEYSPDVVTELVKVVKLMEANWLPGNMDDRCLEAFKIVSKVDAQLTPQARSAWRWRIFYLRALLDSEMFQRQGKLEGDVMRDAFQELTVIYHAQNAHTMSVKPPVIP